MQVAARVECSGSLVPANRKGTAEVETTGDQRLDRRETEARANSISYSSTITHARTAAAGADSEPTTGTDQGSPIERLQGDRVIRRERTVRWTTGDSSTAKNTTEKKKTQQRESQVACSRRPGERRSATPILIVSFHGSPVLFSVLQGRPRFPSKTWNRESVGEGRGGGQGGWLDGVRARSTDEKGRPM